MALQTIHKKKQTTARPLRQPAKAVQAKAQPYLLPLLGILLITFIAYLPALQNHFAWDDEQYIQNNPLIHSINLKKLFSTYVMGNYHPVTMLVYAIEYKLFGLGEKGYHFINLLIHLANVSLVFFIIYKISDKVIVALVTSLLFGIHPMHVESVAWASELKDLLYTFFFLSSYFFYLEYIHTGITSKDDGNRKQNAVTAHSSPQKRKTRMYAWCLALFLFALLSKAMAASLPVVLLLTDYFSKRKLNAKAWIEKLPFFALAIILGIVAIKAQQSAEAIKTEFYPFTERLIFACYGFITYIVKLVVPLQLIAFYRYPVDSGAPVPAIYYSYVLLIILLAAAALYSLRHSRKVFFAIGFFTATVFLVLQLLPVGGTVIADRYSYIPSIALFYLAGEGFYYWWNKKAYKQPAIALLACFTLFFTVKTYSQCAVWKDGLTLWNDVINHAPDLSIAYYNRAVLLKDQGKMQEAFEDFERTIKYNPDYVQAYNNRGIILAMNKQYEQAISSFDKSIRLQPNNPEAYANRGISYQNMNRNDDALKDYEKAIELKPNSPQAFYNKAVIEYNSGNKETGCADFNKSLELGFPMAEETVGRLCK